MNTPTTETIYEQLGISKEVWAFGQKNVLKNLTETLNTIS